MSACVLLVDRCVRDTSGKRHLHSFIGEKKMYLFLSSCHRLSRLVTPLITVHQSHCTPSSSSSFHTVWGLIINFTFTLYLAIHLSSERCTNVHLNLRVYACLCPSWYEREQRRRRRKSPSSSSCLLQINTLPFLLSFFLFSFFSRAQCE